VSFDGHRQTPGWAVWKSARLHTGYGLDPRGDTMAEVQLVARHTMQAGSEDEVLALLEQITEAVRAEPGNVAFEAYRSMEDPRTYVLLERYASPEALTAHRETPHFKELVLGELVPRLSARTVDAYEVPEPTS
jgi:quinol monooxygenase YgiN